MSAPVAPAKLVKRPAQLDAPITINAARPLAADLVIVDDLDRCLPATAIATLEAIRLFLFVPRTAFVIGADELIDLQPCGGTHVANTAEIGAVVVTKIEKKSATTRRVVLGFAA